MGKRQVGRWGLPPRRPAPEAREGHPGGFTWPFPVNVLVQVQEPLASVLAFLSQTKLLDP